VNEETEAVMYESFFLFLSRGVRTELLADTSTAFRCQPSVCVCDQERQIGGCVVRGAIFAYLDVAGKRCEERYICASV
jgi:hypothetical protein